MHPIGTNERRTAHAFAGRQQQRHARRVLLEPYAVRIDVDRSRRTPRQRFDQGMVEITTMHQPVRRAIACDSIGAEILNPPSLTGVEQPHVLGHRH